MNRKCNLIPVGITQNINSRNPTLVDIQLCYIIRHPDSTKITWHVRREHSMPQTSIFVNDIVEMLGVYYKVPFFLNVKKGDIVTTFQMKKLIKHGFLPKDMEVKNVK